MQSILIQGIVDFRIVIFRTCWFSHTSSVRIVPIGCAASRAYALAGFHVVSAYGACELKMKGIYPAFIAVGTGVAGHLLSASNGIVQDRFNNVIENRIGVVKAICDRNGHESKGIVYWHD